MREARGVVTDTHEVHAAQSWEGQPVLELTFWRDNSGSTVVIPLENATALAVDIIEASTRAYRDEVPEVRK